MGEYELTFARRAEFWWCDNALPAISHFCHHYAQPIIGILFGLLMIYGLYVCYFDHRKYK